jgi:uncharacterized protein (TIGR02284 family)
MSIDPTQQSETKDVVFALNACIETCTDGEKGYASAAADVREPKLKDFLQQKSRQRAEFVVALQQAAQQLRAVPENEGTAKGAIHRGWVGVRKAVEGRSDRLILEECQRGEQAALRAYQAALKHAPLKTLSPQLRGLLQTQYSAIQSALDELRGQLALH